MHVELAPGITANVSPDVSPATIAALQALAASLRYREVHGYMSDEPIAIQDGIDYENRDVLCASCGALMPHSPWPTNSKSFLHRPRCGKCHSSMTCPADDKLTRAELQRRGFPAPA